VPISVIALSRCLPLFSRPGISGSQWVEPDLVLLRACARERLLALQPMRRSRRHIIHIGMTEDEECHYSGASIAGG
jgi:hypothetical protein